MIPRISLRLALYTDFGPAGIRLRRGTPLPVSRFDFPDTPEGRKEAEIAQEQMQQYVDRYHVPKFREGKDA